MKKIKTKEEYLKVIKEINKHDKLYYQEFKPVISDYEYDLLMKSLEEFEKEHKNLVVENSPTKRVGEKLSLGFKKVAHESPMYSLANAYSKKEVLDFIKRVEKILNKKDLFFCIELKLDGTAVSVRYENGKLKRALSRGNGKIGDDITNNIKTIKTLPLTIPYKDDLEVRGEVFMYKKTFLRLNKKRQDEGLDVFANPRNAAAGSLKLLDPKEVFYRNLDIIFYGIATEEILLSSQFDVHKFLKKINLPVSKDNYFTKVRSIDEIFTFAKKIENEREKLFFEIDGIVIKVDDLKTHKKLGHTGKSPRFAVAYKFAPVQAYTQIEDIFVQVGRTGVLTPVAKLKPVLLAGSTISKATLHNMDEIRRKDIRIKDFVLVEKGGDVIPKVVSVDINKRDKSSKPWNMVRTCPSCGSKPIKKEGEVAYRCVNKKCAARRLRHISFFTSKAAFDIENLGIKVVEKLIENGLITTAADIFTLTKEDFLQLEGFKEKSADNLYKSIQKAKNPSLWRFIMGLEINYVGSETAQLLEKNFKNIENVLHAKKEDFLQIVGIGDKVADSLFEYFQDEKNIKEIKRFFSYDVRPKKFQSLKVKQSFLNKTFVLTGTLEKYTRDEAYSLIKERGGKTSSSVSKNTDFVLVGKDPGSKYEKAKKLGIKMIEEKEFEKML